MTAIEVRDLVKRYRGATAAALGGVSFDVADGELFCLLGPNGAGKTTTVAILITTLRPSSGRVRVAGFDLAREQSAVRRAVGVVFQQPTVDVNLTVEENLRVHAVLYGAYPWRPAFRLMPAGYRRLVGELADVLGLRDLLHTRAGTLSGGTRRKLEIVRALLHRPAVLFLDEPSTGLDPQARRDLWAYLAEARRRWGTTIVLTTHYLHEAEDADAVCVLAGGRIIERGTPAELIARHGDPRLLLDAADRAALRAELAALGLPATGDPDAPPRLPLADRDVRTLLGALRTPVTRVELNPPSLEEAYLRLLAADRNGAGR
jgi:ABC-2 type transport system ATP-binding protein